MSWIQQTRKAVNEMIQPQAAKERAKRLRGLADAVAQRPKEPDYYGEFNRAAITIEDLTEQLAAAQVERERLLSTLKHAYRKHWLGDESIGWAELGTEILDTLCEVMGDKCFQEWAEARREARRKGGENDGG